MRRRFARFGPGVKRETVDDSAPYEGPEPDAAASATAYAAPRVTAGQSRPRFLGTLAILWLAGMALRLTILAVAPVLPMIHHDLGLSETSIGTLGSLPSLLFAFAAIPGALLISRFGAQPTLVVGLLLTAIGSAVRGAAPGIVMLDAATILMAGGIAIMQPALPPLVRDWMPGRVGFATAVYTNGLLVSELLAVALAIPIVLPLAHGSWRLSLVLWSLPIVATALIVIAFSPRAPRPLAPRSVEARRWWPDWRDPLVWRLGVLLGSVNTIYWCANTFLPDYLNSLGRPDLIGDTLSALNGGQIPGSLVMIALAGRLIRHHATYITMGVLLVASVFGIVLGQADAVVWWAALLGCANAVTLILMLALPALLGAPQDVHRISAAMFTISYPCAVVLPILGGFAWDVTGIPALAFTPVALGAVAILVFSPGLRLRPT